MPASTPVLWPEVNIAFEGVDLILHAGDLEMVGVLDMLEEIAPVLAAEGNHDQGLSEFDSRIKKKQFLQTILQRLLILQKMILIILRI